MDRSRKAEKMCGRTLLLLLATLPAAAGFLVLVDDTRRTSFQHALRSPRQLPFVGGLLDPSRERTRHLFQQQQARGVYYGRQVPQPLKLSSDPSSFFPSDASTPSSWKRQRMIQLLAVSLGLLFAFAGGYRFGIRGNSELMMEASKKVVGEASKQVVSQKVRRFPFLATVGVLLLLRDGWRVLPLWFKRSLTRIVSNDARAAVTKITKTKAVLGTSTKTKKKDTTITKKKEVIDAVIEKEEVANDDDDKDKTPSLLEQWQGKISNLGVSLGDAEDGLMSDLVDDNDMTDMRVLGKKLQALMDTAQVKLSEQLVLDHPDATSTTDAKPVQLNTFGPLLALVQLLAQLKERGDVERTKRYETSGKLGTFQDIKELGQYFEYADWAYDECPSGASLQENLESEGFSLLRHDTTTMPGYVGHYVAINKEKKLALIGVKGTSNFEDMLTDCCGLAVSCKLEKPFVPGGSRDIRCHEGVLISSRRLADDLQDFVEQLLLPTGYKICIVGHSLGAAGAAMLAVFLKSRISELRNDVNGNRMRVLAYACPPILDYSNAVDCASFIQTIVNNSDVIPRASLSNLVIALRVLKDVNEKLKEKGMDGSTALSTFEFWKKLASGNKGDLLMEADELEVSLDRAVDTVELDDPDHLYVPGRVVTMYDKWGTSVAPKVDAANDKSTERKENVKDDKQDKEEPEVERGFVLSPDGSSDVLRTIEWNTLMMEDHMAPSYRTSLKAILTAAQQK